MISVSYGIIILSNSIIYFTIQVTENSYETFTLNVQLSSILPHQCSQRAVRYQSAFDYLILHCFRERFEVGTVAFVLNSIWK